MSGARRWAPLAALAVVAAYAIGIKLSLLNVGSPYVTIDDRSTFEGGFLVWFGNSPPQRMFLECWLAGLTSLATFVAKVGAGAAAGSLGPDLVAQAYRDFSSAPDLYVRVYRVLVLLLDVLAAWLTFRLARHVLGDRWRGWAAVVPPAVYLLAYNTVWADLVARPDNMLAVFSVGGYLLYLRSDGGDRTAPLLWSGVLFGLGTGLKLHLAFFVVVVLADMVRRHGLLGGLRRGWLFGAISVLCFALAAGIPLFDPLKYVKLRMTNAKDDHSPWIRWGEQFVVMLRGTGWLVLPLLLAGLVFPRGRQWARSSPAAAGLTLAVVLFLVFFGLIRQLRGYWMLPVLPLFATAAVGALVTWDRRRAGAAALALLILICGAQTWREAARFRNVEYEGLRTWITTNVERDEPFYVFGYDALVLPRSTEAMALIRRGYEREFERDVAEGLPHVERHLKNWEEETLLELHDLLGHRHDEGWTHYGSMVTPLDKMGDLVDMGSMRAIVVEQGFEDPPEFDLPAYLAAGFHEVATVEGAGGGGYGLRYRIYERTGTDGR